MQSNDRLDRIETILVSVAEGQARLQERQTAFQTQLETTQTQLEATMRLAQLTLDIANSNARSVQALGTTIEEDRAEREEVESVLQVDVVRNTSLIQLLISESRENLRQHRAFVERFERVLGEIRLIWERIAG